MIVGDGKAGARTEVLRGWLVAWAREFVTDQGGSELVEFACAASILFTCLFGIMGVCNAYAAYHFASYSAREATRYAMVRGTTWKANSCTTPATMNCMATSANILAFVQSRVPVGMSKGTALTVTTTWPGTALSGGSMACKKSNGNNGPGCLVQVNVKYSFSYLMPFLPTSALAMQASSSVVILQ